MQQIYFIHYINVIFKLYLVQLTACIVLKTMLGFGCTMAL